MSRRSFPVGGHLQGLRQGLARRLARVYGVGVRRVLAVAAGLVLVVPAVGEAAFRTDGGVARARALQIELAWHGFPSGRIDGRFGPELAAAVRGFQRSVGIAPSGVVGRATLRALSEPALRSPILLVWPVLAPIGDGFGPRGAGFHAGIDLLASVGTPVVAAAPGRVTWAGWKVGGWGKLVVVRHADGVQTLYAHLESISVRVGWVVSGGTILGRVGATGNATGPHLHFEVHVRGAAIDPLGALVPLP
jgi:murein DD-endopeptidase MepM/ murein hydrolase activator NlpD